MTDRTCICSFCGKSNHDATILIAAPADAFICDTCVDLCIPIVVKARAAKVVSIAGSEDLARQIVKEELAAFRDELRVAGPNFGFGDRP